MSVSGLGNLIYPYRNTAQNVTQEAYNSQELQQLYQYQQASMQQNVQQAAAIRPVPIHEHAQQLLMGRLHGLATMFTMSTNDFLLCHMHGEKVYVFFIHDDRVGYLEDDANLFPSDKLVTQIRLLWS